MSIRKLVPFAGAAVIALVFASVPVAAQGTDPIAAVDNIPPEEPANIETDVNLLPPSVTLTWDRSPSDLVGVVSVGGGGGAGGVVATNDVTEYIIERSESGADAVEIMRVAPGVTRWVDETVITGPAYTYLVSAFDGTNLSDAIASFPVIVSEPPSIIVSALGPLEFNLGAGESDAETVTVTNAAAAEGPLTFSAVASPAGFFSSAVDQVTLQPGESIDVEIGFDATLAGNLNGLHTGLVVLVTNDPDDREVIIAVTATVSGGTETPLVDVPSVLSYGSVELGNSSTKTLRVSNAGGEPLNAVLSLSGDPVFAFVGESSITVPAGETAEVVLSFTPADNIFYDGIVTIASDDPFRPAVEVEVKGLGRIQGEGTKPATRKLHKLSVVFLTNIDFSDPVAVEDCETKARNNIQAILPPGFIVVNVTCAEGSTIVDFEIEPDPDAVDPPAITTEEALAELITTIEDPEVEVFVDLVDDLGDVASVTDETETLSAQPSDADGADIVGWFTREGTRVDFDDFFTFADGFGQTVDSAALDVLDIAGPNQGPPDGLVNFDDFFRFADDFGKTVANAEEVRTVLGL